MPRQNYFVLKDADIYAKDIMLIWYWLIHLNPGWYRLKISFINVNGRLLKEWNSRIR